MQWINANINFGSSHQYTQELAENLKTAKVTRDYAILLKKCFSLQAFRTRRKNAWHVRFRANSTADPYCENFDYKYLKEAALVAYNENVFLLIFWCSMFNWSLAIVCMSINELFSFLIGLPNWKARRQKRIWRKFRAVQLSRNTRKRQT